MTRRILAAALAIAMVLALIGCGGATTTPTPSGSGTGTGTGSTESDGNATVTIENFAFAPTSVEIKTGGSVVWTNKDSATHTVTGDGGIASGDLAQGKSYTKTFDAAGTYNYSCSIHPSMTGTVVVK